jgi:anti-sigma factor RsiW
MNCSECRLALHAHLDDELEVVNARTVEEHLASCAACTAESAALRALGEKLKAQAERPEPPAGFEERLRASLRASLRDNAVDGAMDGAPPAVRPVRRLRLAMFVPLAAAALLLAWFAGFEAGRPGARGRAVDQLVALHVRSTNPSGAIEVASSDRHTVNPWFQGRVPFGVGARDFADQGFALVGGRVETLDGEPAAALVYRHGPHVVTVVVARTSGADAGPTTSQDAGYRIARWRAAGLERIVVSDVDAAALDAFVVLLRAGP